MNDRLCHDERLDLETPDAYPPGTVERHLARYHWAAGKLQAMGVSGRVLDAACGTGYGSAILKAAASEVVGLDKSFEAVKLAHARYGKGDGRATFFACDLDERLPYPAAAFAAVVSVETIEHLQAPGRFLTEARRVLAPGGVLLLSTPEAAYDEDPKTKARVARKPTNPYHIREFLRPELERLVQEHGFVGAATEAVAAVPGFLFLAARAA